MITLVGCNNDASQDSVESELNNGDNNEKGIILLDNVEQGWIDFDGELGGNVNYITTSFITYSPSQNYELNMGAYISYYNGEKFIETVLQDGEGEIPTVENADSIKLSFHKEKSNEITLLTE